jgi:hypothetical protein
MKFIRRFSVPVFLLFLVCVLFKPALAAILFSAILAIIWVDLHRTVRQIRNAGIDAMAVLERYDRDADGDAVPVLVFETVEGKRIEGNPLVFLSASFGMGMSHKKEAGAATEIRYHPDDPARFLLKADESTARTILWLLMVLVVMAAAAGIAGLLGYLEING